MKKLTLLLILVLPFLSPIYSQSFISFRTNLFSFSSTDYTSDYNKAKVGFGIGHKNYFRNESRVKIILSENLDYKQTDFYYTQGSLAGGYSTKGNIHFLNAQVDLRARVGGKIFGELGIFTAYSLVKKITNGQVNVSRNCSLTPPGVNCIPQSYFEITDESKDFSPLDYGLIVGIGYSFKDLTFVLDGQLGLHQIMNLRDYQFKSRQINLSVTFPLKKLKF
jgi:hypothetical protein